MIAELKLFWNAAKLYIIIMISVTWSAGLIYYTSQFWINKYKAKALNTANAMTLIKNENSKLIAKYSREIERLENVSKQKAAAIKPLIITSNCNELLFDIDRLHDQLIDSLP